MREVERAEIEGELLENLKKVVVKKVTKLELKLARLETEGEELREEERKQGEEELEAKKAHLERLDKLGEAWKEDWRKVKDSYEEAEKEILKKLGELSRKDTRGAGKETGESEEERKEEEEREGKENRERKVRLKKRKEEKRQEKEKEEKAVLAEGGESEKEEREGRVVIKGLKEVGDLVEAVLETVGYFGGGGVTIMKVKEMSGGLRERGRMARVLLGSKEEREEVLRRKSKLRGRREFIEEDLTFEERRERWKKAQELERDRRREAAEWKEKGKEEGNGV